MWEKERGLFGLLKARGEGDYRGEGGGAVEDSAFIVGARRRGRRRRELLELICIFSRQKRRGERRRRRVALFLGCIWVKSIEATQKKGWMGGRRGEMKCSETA